MARLLLLNINIATNKAEYLEGLATKPCIGNLHVGTFLEFNGHEVTMAEIPDNSASSLSDLMALIEKVSPRIIGFSAYTETNNMALSVAKEIKRKYPDIITVFGGPHPTLAPMDVILSKHVDFLILKEGESTIVELVVAIETREQTIKYDDIPGLVFKRGNGITKNDFRANITDLDLLPIIKRELGGIEKFRGVINVSSSRGCPGKCIYCSAAALSGSKYRTRDERNVFMEFVMLKVLLGERVKEIYITDDTFTAIPNRAKKFAQLIQNNNFNVYWRCESRVDVMTEDLIKELAESGLVSIQYGIESGSQEVLNILKKEIDLEQARKTIDLTSEAGVHICLSFMLGHFCDTKDTMRQTIDFIKDMYHRYPGSQLVIGYNTPFPGTWQHTRMEQLGMRLVTQRYENFTLSQPVIETDNFTTKDLINFNKMAEPYLWHIEKTYKESMKLEQSLLDH